MTNYRLPRRRWTITAVTVAALVIPGASASGQSSSVDTYGGGGSIAAQVETQGSAGSAGSGTADPPAPGALPFSGFDAALALGGGVVLLGAGAGMAALSRRRQPAGPGDFGS